jgi:2-polyprenyl-3-methyl-5-hydroxy-6-metoxy-1,4-benzoquinol methylase
LAGIYSNYYGDEGDSRQTALQLSYRLPVFENLCDLLEPQKKANAQLLDIGCGNGDFIWLAQMRGWNVRGVELSQTAVNYATQKRNLHVDLGSPKHLPYENESFDVVTVLDVLEHLSNPVEVLGSVERVLKKNGIAIIQVPNTPFQILKARVQKLKSRNRTTMATPLHINHFDAKTLAQFAERAHLKVERVFPGYADSGGPGLQLKSAYVLASRLWFKATGYQAGHSLCLVARKT